MTGTTVGHYRILERLGKGGMGEVYLAEDLKLKRKLAIKFITEDLTRDESRRQRFVQEAMLAAAVHHPHVAAIYEVDQIDGRTFIAMEYVRGETLRAVLTRGPLPLKRALELSTQIADALAKVHQHGVAHRDLKPENVIVADDGYAKIIDFGVAKLTEPVAGSADAATATELRVRTADGLVLGTFAYMSPEQARGTQVDARSDIFSFGVLLHEMLTGVAPFRRPSAAETLSAILSETPPPAVSDAGVAPELQRIVRKCLEKDRDARFQSMREVVVDLKGVRDALGRSGSTIATSASPERTAPNRRRLAGAVALLLLVVAGVATWMYATGRWGGGSASTPSGRPAIAVMNFENLGGGADTAWLSAGLSSMLVTGLAQSPEMEVVTTDRLNEAARQVGQPRFETVDPAQRLGVIKRAGATFVVNGTIVTLPNGLRIDARVENLATGRVTLADNVSGKDPLALADALAVRIRQKLDVRPEGAVRPVAELTSKSIEAYRLYSQGREAFGNARRPDAERLYKEAIAVDPDFAMASFGIAEVELKTGRRKEGLVHLAAAAAHRDRLSERDALFVQAMIDREERRYHESVLKYERLIMRYPESAEAYIGAADVHKFFLGNAAKAVELLQRGMNAVPTSGPLANELGYAYMADGRPELGVPAFQAYVRLRPSESNAIDSLAEGQLHAGNLVDALASAQRALDAGHRDPTISSWILAVQGRLDEALRRALPGSTSAKALMLSRLGRFREAEDMRGRLQKSFETDGNINQAGLLQGMQAMFALERGDCAGAVASAKLMTDTLGSLPEASKPWPAIFADLVVGTCEARAKNFTSARARLEHQRQIIQPTAIDQRWWRDMLEAEIALAEGHAPRAAELFELAEPAGKMPFERIGPPMFATLWSNSLSLRDGLARARAAQGNPEEAIKIYRRLLIVDQSSKHVAFFEPRYLLALAGLLDKVGRKDDARAQYRRFLEYWSAADPGLPEVADAKRHGG